MKTALITGITGQDGSYLAELLLEKGYQVHGTVRHSSTPNTERIAGILDYITLHRADLLDLSSLIHVLKKVQPQEVYNLAALSFVPTSWEQPILSGEITALGVTRMLEAIRLVNPGIRFYQAGSSEMFGSAPAPQSETTPFQPRSPYGVSKAYGHWITVNYRESYNLFACSGILFNHESPRRGPEFVTRKIAMAAARGKKVRLGSLTPLRDWGYAADYVRAMWLMLQQDKPRDYVIGTGEAYPVGAFLSLAYDCVGLDWRTHLEHDPGLLRPAEVDCLRADASRAAQELDWQPTVLFPALVKILVHAELEQCNRPHC
jgi:GDPmannose 4,6-dehydratase